MVLIILATLLVLGIAFFQVIQGVFSALIMAILSILSAAVAFSYYEPLAKLLYEHQPAAANAICLTGIFAVTLLALRLIFDRLIGANVVLGLWVNRIGGGFFGLIAAMVCVGVLTTSLQMLPLGATILTYRPFEDSLERKQGLAPFYPDGFTIGLVDMLSGGSLAGKRTFNSVHDNLPLEAFCTRNTAEQYGRVDAKPKDLMSVEAFEAPAPNLAPWRQDVPDNPLLDPTTLTKDIIVRCKVAEEASDPADAGSESKARWCFPGTHFRLTCSSGRSYYPIAYLTRTASAWEAQVPPIEENKPLRAMLVVGRTKGTETFLIIDWVYRVAQEDAPHYMTFRQTAQLPLPAEPPQQMPPTAGALDKGTGKR